MKQNIYHEILWSATLFVAAASLCLTVSAKEINVNEAMNVAKAFMVGKGTSAAKVNGKSQVKMSLAYTGKGDDQNLLYAFNKSGENGFVIVAGDDCVENQVLGYSDSGTFDYDNMPKNAKAWIDGYSSMIAAAVKSGQKITSRSMAASDKDTVVVAPLITTKWGQDAPYNSNCPVYDGKTCPTGCVATAMAQVMNYHEWPKTGTGSHSYVWEKESDTLSVDFSKETFDWDNMADIYDDTSTNEQNAAVAQLMYDCGVAVNMQYGIYGSVASSNSVMYALYRYFGYDDGMEYLYRDLTEYDEWIKKLKDNLDSNCPVYYRGVSSDGHAFVIDGYSSNDYFHVNWGWNGNKDGYYLLLSLNGFNSGQAAIFNIKPDDGIPASNTLSLNFGFGYKQKDDTSLLLTTQILPIMVNGLENVRWQCRLLDSNDSIVKTYATLCADTSVYYAGIAQTIDIDSTVTDGNYRLYHYYKNAETGTWHTMELYHSGNNYLDVTVINNKIRANYRGCSITSISDTINNRLYNEENNAIKIGFVNDSKKNYSFNVCIVVANDKDSIVYKGGLHHVDIAAGDTTVCTWYDMIDVDEGNYTMYLVDKKNAPQFYLNKVTVTTPQLAVDSFYVYALNADNSYTVSLRPDFRQQLNKVDDGMYQTNDANGVPYHWITGKSLPNPAPNGMYNGKPVTSMAGMFAGCDNVSSLDLNKFYINPSTMDLTDMFKDCGTITKDGFALCLVVSDSIASILNTASITGIDTLRMQCTSMNSSDYYNYTLLSDSTYRVGLKEDFKDAINHGLSFKKYRTGNPFPNPCPNGKYRGIKVTDMSEMFSDCWNLTNLDVSSFNTSNVTNMNNMFSYCSSLPSLDLSSFNTSKVTDMNNMFYNCSSLASLDLSSFNTSNVTDMNSSFSDCSSLTSLDVSSFNTSNVTKMSWMFVGCSSLSSLDLSSFNTSNVTDMNNMFSECSSLISLDVSSFNTSNVTDMNNMFYNCSSLASLDVSSFNTSHVTNMFLMFYYCSSLPSLDLSSFNTSHVTDMSWMFAGCSSLSSLDVSSFNTSHVTNMNNMFVICSSLTSLDLSNFTVSSETSINYMFYGTCSANESGSPIIGYAMDGITADLFNNSETTSIDLSKLKFNAISTDMKQVSTPVTDKNTIYNIDGMKVLVPRKGNVYIRDGKKVAF